jgi:hypothetical protein
VDNVLDINIPLEACLTYVFHLRRQNPVTEEALDMYIPLEARLTYIFHWRYQNPVTEEVLDIYIPLEVPKSSNRGGAGHISPI